MRKVSHIQLHSPIFIPGGPGNLSATIKVTDKKSDKEPTSMVQTDIGILITINNIEVIVPYSNVQVMVLEAAAKVEAKPILAHKK